MLEKVQNVFDFSFGKNVRLSHLKRFIKDKPFNRAAELGCGEGYLLHNLVSEVKLGYDLCPKQIFNDITYLVADFDSVYNLEQNLDLVVISEVIEHVIKDKDLLRNAWKSLCRGGKIFLSTINKNVTDKSEQDKRFGHLRRYDSDLADFMEEIGFETNHFYGFRGDNYYITKKLGFKNYDINLDILDLYEHASGLVYCGVKNG